MKKILFFLLLCLMMVSFANAQTNVTFWLNTATVPDTVTPNSSVQVRGDTAPLTWSDDTGGVLEHVQGDLWKVTLEFNAADTINYKFAVQANVDGGGGWEAGGNNKLGIPASDTTLDVHYYVKDDAFDGTTPPFTETDSIDVWLRVNMQGNPNFDRNTQFVGVRGAFPESAGWSKTIPLSKETPHTGAGNFSYPTSFFWSGQTSFNIGGNLSPGDTITYKFVITAESGGDPLATGGWEDNINDRVFVVPTKDTTVVWDFWDKIPPASATNEDTVVVEFFVDMARALSSRGFFPADTAFVRAGFSGTANLLTDIPLVNAEGTSIWTGKDTVVATIGGEIEYDYRLTKFGAEVREAFYDFDFVPDDPSEQGRAERRRATLTGASSMVVDDSPSELSPRRQPFFRNTQVLAQDVLVTYEVDMRPAIFELLYSDPTDTLIDTQGNRDVFDPNSVLTLGVWMNGIAVGDWSNPTGGDWGQGLEDNLRKKMFDDGSNGDAVAGDSVFTRQVQTSPDSIAIGSKGTVGQIFKFGIGAGDNEGGFGNNHIANIDDNGTAYTVRAQFGSIDPRKYDHWDYENMVPVISSVELANELVPNAFALEQNYPNPFNPETSISYAIPQSGDVKLSVYNLLGQRVAVLVNENQIAGNYTAKWNGQNEAGISVSSGVYVYKIEVDNFVQIKKMLLIK